jgi:predicted MFS family arabinose efflux permease
VAGGLCGVAGLSLVVLLAQLALLPRLGGGTPATPRAFAALLRVRLAAFGFVAAGFAAAGHFAAYTISSHFCRKPQASRRTH